MPASENEKPYDIRERAFQFAIRIVKLCRYLETKTRVSKVLIGQLLAAGTSIGANLQEADSGETTKDFVHKNAISLKEAKETRYWLRLIIAGHELDPDIRDGIQELSDEARELTLIIAKIIVNKKKST